MFSFKVYAEAVSENKFTTGDSFRILIDTLNKIINEQLTYFATPLINKKPDEYS